MRPCQRPVYRKQEISSCPFDPGCCSRIADPRSVDHQLFWRTHQAGTSTEKSRVRQRYPGHGRTATPWCGDSLSIAEIIWRAGMNAVWPTQGSAPRVGEERAARCTQESNDCAKSLLMSCGIKCGSSNSRPRWSAMSLVWDALWKRGAYAVSAVRTLREVHSPPWMRSNVRSHSESQNYGLALDCDGGC